MKTKQIFWKLSACACAVLLTGCGSDGNAVVVSHSSHTTSTQTATNQTNSNTQNPQTTETVDITKAVSSNEKFGGYGVIKGKAMKSVDKNTIIVEGKTIKLYNPSMENLGNGWFEGEVDGANHSFNNNYTYVTFGAYETRSSSDVLANGELTPVGNMPNSNTVHYVGNSLYEEPSSKQWYRGTAELTVDFGAKKIAGELLPNANQSTHPKYELEGDITGNAFNGEKNGVKMQGHFFGPNAEELAGTFNDTKANLKGAFGAKQH